MKGSNVSRNPERVWPWKFVELVGENSVEDISRRLWDFVLGLSNSSEVGEGFVLVTAPFSDGAVADVWGALAELASNRASGPDAPEYSRGCGVGRFGNIAIAPDIGDLQSVRDFSAEPIDIVAIVLDRHGARNRSILRAARLCDALCAGGVGVVILESAVSFRPWPVIDVLEQEMARS